MRAGPRRHPLAAPTHDRTDHGDRVVASARWISGVRWQNRRRGAARLLRARDTNSPVVAAARTPGCRGGGRWSGRTRTHPDFGYLPATAASIALTPFPACSCMSSTSYCTAGCVSCISYSAMVPPEPSQLAIWTESSLGRADSDSFRFSFTSAVVLVVLEWGSTWAAGCLGRWQRFLSRQLSGRIQVRLVAGSALPNRLFFSFLRLHVMCSALAIFPPPPDLVSPCSVSPYVVVSPRQHGSCRCGRCLPQDAGCYRSVTARDSQLPRTLDECGKSRAFGVLCAHTRVLGRRSSSVSTARCLCVGVRKPASSRVDVCCRLNLGVHLPSHYRTVLG